MVTTSPFFGLSVPLPSLRSFRVTPMMTADDGSWGEMVEWSSRKQECWAVAGGMGRRWAKEEEARYRQDFKLVEE